MNKTAKCLAVIPARGGSKGLLQKNIRMLDGSPLIEYTIEAALKSGCMDVVVVSTDNDEIARIAELAGADIPFLRPVELATDESASIDVLKHAVHFYELKLNLHFQYIMLLQPTSPLRNDYDIREAYQLFITHKADSLQSITLADTHPYLLREWNQGIIQPYLKDQAGNLRRQELPELYMLNGAIYIIKRDLLMDENLMVGPNNIGYIMPKERSVDIDDEMDLKWAEFLMQNRV
ncbi:cytidylyltransferase domain-containing protein [Paenibacillus sp. UASWS1643]|uniref:acylneuraminate cytidylyltransferase family protein n=1 Tax=Paenibacillus sp. UASWS1643 TaxID=2580422 RepID=UPI00123BD43B|nr:acylneuraminate cytidylyltransferase family protein [Paenibacillus sp. UASWS1643]KAA8756259.1 acylneuraminate cytidylyltransferase family protein [Paenibacillus sp. UASWS1643]